MAVRSPIVLSDRAVEQLAQAIQTVRIESTSLDWPAWVQAVGSVIAIVAAVLIARSEAKRERAATAEQAERDRAVAAEDAQREQIRETRSAAELVEIIAHHWERAMEPLSYMAQNSGDLVNNGADLAVVEGVLRDDLESLRFRICPPISKLSELPLTAWPNVDLGLDFYAFEANLVRVTSSLERMMKVDPKSYPGPFRTIASGFIAELRSMYGEAEQALAEYQAQVSEHRAKAAALGFETRLAKRERETAEVRARERAQSIEAETTRRATERAQIIASFPPDGERTAAQTAILEMRLRTLNLDPLQPLSEEEQAEEDRAEAEHYAEMARRDKADRARREARDQRDRDYDRAYGNGAADDHG